MSPARLQLTTMGHATLVIHEPGARPILITDPWLVGSVYWRSWWLQNYPSEAELDWLGSAETVYVTHEHPDHFHMPSIRRLGPGPLYLFPALTWRTLGKGVGVLSIPVWNDDSLLLIDTPGALVINLNDAKPLPPVVRAIRRLADRANKPKVMLCSYSPASLVNSFSDASGPLSLKKPEQYVAYVSRLADRVGADLYLPFASQAEFRREDSAWANEYRTTYEDLGRHWSARARLLPPHATLDLGDLSFSAVPPERFRAADLQRTKTLTGAREAAERDSVIEDGDVAGFLRKFNAFRYLWMLVFPRGFTLALGARRWRYAPWRGTLADAQTDAGDFVLSVPPLALKEAVRNDHVTDLGITMFVRIRLLRRIDPRKIYAIFVLFQVEDYRHLASAGAFWRWLRRGVRYSVGLRLAPPPSPKQA